MTVTKDELESFGHFAAGELDRGNAMSLEQLVIRWRTRQQDDVNNAIRQGLNEADAELGRPLNDFMNEFRVKNEISPNA
jgi:hypothetical protein